MVPDTDSSSLADISSPGASRLHPAQLYQGIFVDVAEVHSTGFLPAADYPQYHEITRQHENRALQTQALLEQYCCSRSPLKKLVLEKEVYGWDLGRLQGGAYFALSEQRTNHTSAVHRARKLC